MAYFRNGKEKKDYLNWVSSADFDACLESLYGPPLDEQNRRRLELYIDDKRTWGAPASLRSLWSVLIEYHSSYRYTRVKNVADSIAKSAYQLICEAKDRDPYIAKKMHERLFKIWPEAFHYAMRAAEKEDTEENLVFLACIHLFGWDVYSDPSCTGGYVEKLGTLDEIKNQSAYEWLKAQIEK